MIIWPNKLRILFKTISACVDGFFLWNQIAWAADIYSIASGRIDKFNEDQTAQFAPDYLAKKQTSQESLIDQMQAVEDFILVDTLSSDKTTEAGDLSLDLRGPIIGSEEAGIQSVSDASSQEILQESASTQENNSIFSITTQQGDIIYYENGVIQKIEKVDGTVFNDLLLDENTGDLINATVEYSDGTIQLVEGGRVTSITKPDNTVFNYKTKEELTGFTGEGSDEELIESVFYPDPTDPEFEGISVTYSYILDELGNVLETTLTDLEKVSYYNDQGRLEKVEFNNGKIIKYNDGILTKVTDEDGKVVYGNFDGQIMIGQDGKQYPVPANYASKSKLVEGDMLKLVITPDGNFVYKQVGPVERKYLLGIIELDARGNHTVEVSGQKYKVLLAAATYFKIEPGDEVTLVVPRDSESVWGAIENVLRKAEDVEKDGSQKTYNSDFSQINRKEEVKKVKEIEETKSNDDGKTQPNAIEKLAKEIEEERNNLKKNNTLILDEWTPDLEEIKKEASYPARSYDK